MSSTPQDKIIYRPLVEACKARGIGRTVAFRLRRQGLIDCFNIGRRPFVYIDSLNSLEKRMREAGRDGSRS